MANSRDESTASPGAASSLEPVPLLDIEDDESESSFEIAPPGTPLDLDESELAPLVEERGLEPLVEESGLAPLVAESGLTPLVEERLEEIALEPIEPPGREDPGVRPRVESGSTAFRAPVGPEEWCRRCGARHVMGVCHGELLAREPERHGWRVAVQTQTGRVIHGVLLAPTGDRWRARIMTYPRTLWTIPGGVKTLKFLGLEPGLAEQKAIEFIQDHCRRRGYVPIEDEALLADPEPIVLEQTVDADEAEPARRKPRSVLIRFGRDKPDRKAHTVDLSEEGMFVATSEPYARGTRIRLLLEIAGARIPLQGTVQWTRNRGFPGRPEGMGVRLVRPPAFYAQYVQRLP